MRKNIKRQIVFPTQKLFIKILAKIRSSLFLVIQKEFLLKVFFDCVDFITFLWAQPAEPRYCSLLQKINESWNKRGLTIGLNIDGVSILKRLFFRWPWCFPYKLSLLSFPFFARKLKLKSTSNFLNFDHVLFWFVFVFVPAAARSHWNGT